MSDLQGYDLNFAQDLISMCIASYPNPVLVRNVPKHVFAWLCDHAGLAPGIADGGPAFTLFDEVRARAVIGLSVH